MPEQREKEYVKYEDGKIVNVAPPKKKPVKENPLKQLNLPQVKKEVHHFFVHDKKKLVRYLAIGFTLFSVLFLSLYYLTDWFASPVEEPPAPDNRPVYDRVIQERNEERKEPVKTSEKPPAVVEIYVSGTPAPTEPEEAEVDINTSFHPIRNPIALTENLSDEVYALNQRENRRMTDFFNARQTRATTLRNMAKSFDEKTALYVRLTSQKEWFEGDALQYLYVLSEQRLLSSLKKTETLMAELEASRPSSHMRQTITEFNEIDTRLKKTYDSTLVVILDALEVPYTKETFEVHFNLMDIQ